MSTKKEIRIQSSELEIREADEGKLPTLEGYAAVFNSETVIAGVFREVIKPGAFKRAISEKQDVRALVDHDSGRIIGRTTSGTLSLREDSKGLRVAIEPANTTAGRDIVESVKRGDVSGMSFGFIPKSSVWREDEGELDLREIEDVDLFDVSVVTYPAYDATSVSARSAEEILSEHEREEKEKAEAEKADVEAYHSNMKKLLDAIE